MYIINRINCFYCLWVACFGAAGRGKVQYLTGKGTPHTVYPLLATQLQFYVVQAIYVLIAIIAIKYLGMELILQKAWVAA